MFEIKLEDLQTMVAGLKDSRIEYDPDGRQRAINMKIDNVLIDLRDIEKNALAITWCTGYDPKVYLSEYVAQQIYQIKMLMEM